MSSTTSAQLLIGGFDLIQTMMGRVIKVAKQVAGQSKFGQLDKSLIGKGDLDKSSQLLKNFVSAPDVK